MKDEHEGHDDKRGNDPFLVLDAALKLTLHAQQQSHVMTDAMTIA